MINVGLFIKKDKVFDSGVNETLTNYYIKDSTKYWIDDQWKDYNIRIIEGTGTGYYSKCTSNYLNVLYFDTLPFNLDYTSVFEIYTQLSERVELFHDEKISLTSSIQNSNDIGKLFTDYSQSFTIPASKHNNAIFSHWYESDVDNGYDHRKRYDAYIELDTLTFKVGNVQLEKANKKNGFIESYSVTFYGNLTQLKDKFKDMKLRDISGWNSLNHTYNSTEVINRVESSFMYYLVNYPLIGSQKKYYYKNGISNQDITLSTAPIIWNELFPAVPLERIFYFIQRHFGITFTGSFFDLDQWTKLNLYLKNSEKLVVNSQIIDVDFLTVSATFPELNLETNTLTNDWNFGLIDNNRAFIADIRIWETTAVPFTLYVYRDGLLYSTFENLVSDSGVIRVDYVYHSQDSANHQYTFKIQAESSSTFTSRLFYHTYYGDTTGGFHYVDRFVAANNSTGQTTVQNIQIQNYVPDIKVTDFITGIIKAFNLMVIPTDKDVFEFVPLEQYYNSGKITDITKYVDSESMDIERPKLYKSINFQYEKSNNILNNAYYGLYGKEYGDLIYNADNSNESSNYDIKLPFENVLFEKTVGENFETASLINKDLKPYTPKPMLIYCNGITNVSTPIKITKDIGGIESISQYVRFSNEYNSLPTDATLSALMTMNLNNEQSPWYNVVAPQGLYYRHYSNYINNLYNIKSRVIKIKSMLPVSLLGKIALNDRLILSGKRYLINSFTTDLTTGESNFDLLTDYRNLDARSTIGYRFANYTNVQTDRTEQNLKVVIFKNDYDSFLVKGAENYLIYDPEILDVTIPYNSGADRTDRIGIEFYRNGILEVTEYINFTQTAI